MRVQVLIGLFMCVCAVDDISPPHVSFYLAVYIITANTVFNLLLAQVIDVS